VIGWIGSALLAGCALPQAWKSFKDKHSKGISRSFIWTWTVGELFMFYYIVNDAFSWPLLFNYGINSVFCLIILWYKIKGERRG